MTAYQAALVPSESQVYGEPEWMPSPEHVARARAELERRGAVRALLLGQAGKELVPAGEAPWAWLFAAAAWLLLWPAVIAARVGLGWGSGWLPSWLPVVLALLHVIALLGPVVLADRHSGRQALQRRFACVQTIAQMLALEPEEFEVWIGMLFMLRGYEARNTRHVGDHGVDLEVSGEGVRFGLVQCKRYRGTVGEPAVRDLYGTMTHERADFGWIVTTGAVSRQAREWASGKPIELWDGQALVDLARKQR